MAHGVDRLPGDNHRHNCRLASAGGELESDTREVGVGRKVGVVDPVEDTLITRPLMTRHFGEPDQRFNGFNLAEERAYAAEWIAAPMLQQPRGLRRDVPIRGIWS